MSKPIAAWGAGRGLGTLALAACLAAPAVAVEREAEDLLDLPLRNAQGENLGEVEDLAIDWRDGRVVYAIVSYGGLFDAIGDKLFAVPAKALRLADDHFVLDLPKEQIQESWGFGRYDWPDMDAPDYVARAHDWYKLEQTFEREQSELPADTEVERASAEYLKRQATGTLQKASDLDDMTIVDAAGETIGEVDDLLVDWEQGRVVKVPVEFGGVLGIGETELDLPLSAMTLKARDASSPLRFSKDNVLQLDRTKAQLEAER